MVGTSRARLAERACNVPQQIGRLGVLRGEQETQSRVLEVVGHDLAHETQRIGLDQANEVAARVRHLVRSELALVVGEADGLEGGSVRFVLPDRPGRQVLRLWR